VSTQRCPSCAATVPEGADWCSLCYAVLRQPALVTVPSSPGLGSGDPAGRNAETGLATIDPLTGPLALLDPTPGESTARIRSAAAPTAPLAPAAPTGAAGLEPGPEPEVANWPCLGCGELVSFDLDVCPGCARPFLAMEPGYVQVGGRRLPDLRGISDANKIMLMIGGMLCCTAVLVALFYIVGSVV